MFGIVVGDDYRVSQWAFHEFKFQHSIFDFAFGIIKDRKLVGAILFSGFNGSDIEGSWYGPVTPSVVRRLCRLLIDMRVNRVTIKTSLKNKRLIRSAQRFGFVYEGTSPRYYGPEKTKRNTAIRLVLFRERLQEIADAGNPAPWIQCVVNKQSTDSAISAAAGLPGLNGARLQ